MRRQRLMEMGPAAIWRAAFGSRGGDDAGQGRIMGVADAGEHMVGDMRMEAAGNERQPEAVGRHIGRGSETASGTSSMTSR
jgi:hypothetical protein